MVSVDGDTSTNDMVTVLANGMAGNAEITAEGADFTAFMQALNTVTVHLCRAIAGDGEGATKLLECSVSGAKDTGSGEDGCQGGHLLHRCSRRRCSARTPTGGACSAPSATAARRWM